MNLIRKVLHEAHAIIDRFAERSTLLSFCLPMSLLGPVVACSVAVSINTQDIQMNNGYIASTLLPLAKCVDYISEEQCQIKKESAKQLVELGALDAIDSANAKHYTEPHQIFWLYPKTIKATANARLDLLIERIDIANQADRQKPDFDVRMIEERENAQKMLEKLRVNTNEQIDTLYSSLKLLCFPFPLIAWLVAFVLSRSLKRLLPRINPRNQ